MKKKILFLGGASYQLPSLKEAVSRGYEVSVCTNNPSDPGVSLADYYFDISINDIEAILNLAGKIGASAVVGYVSELAARTAKSVSATLGLPGTPETAYSILTKKDGFRNFQNVNGFTHPKFQIININESVRFNTGALNYPIIIKPVDSCGSRGVSHVKSQSELLEAVKKAYSYSKSDVIIAEEVVAPDGIQVTGDGYMVDGSLKFLCLGEHRYNPELSIVTAIQSVWPAELSDSLLEKIKLELSMQLTAAGYREGPFNADIRIDKSGEVYIIEAAPRNGANYFPQIIEHCTGVNLVKAYFDRLEGQMPDFSIKKNEFAISVIIGSEKNGTFKSVNFPSALQGYIYRKEMFVGLGEPVRKFQNLGDALGTLILTPKTRLLTNELASYTKHKVILESDCAPDIRNTLTSESNG
jgi:biotin carboxylase